MTIPPFPDELGPSGNGPWPRVNLGDITPIEPSYVERPLLQAATFHLFAGRLGVGKGALIMRWLARCTNGEMYGRPRNTLLLASEEDGARDLFPRIKVANGDPKRVRLIPNSFLLPRDIESLRELAQEVEDVGLIALDPLTNHIGGASAEEEVRNALQPLAILAGDLDTVMVGVRHVSSKEASGDFISRILGSSAWPAVPRVVIGAAKDSEGYLHVRALKGNRMRHEDSGRRYRLESAQFLDWEETVVVAVEDGESVADIDELLGKQRVSSNSEGAREEIVRLLREEGGQMESDLLDGRVAEETGLTARTVRDLRTELGDRGWLRSVPMKNVDGRIDHWEVALTNFAPVTHDSGGSVRHGDHLETEGFQGTKVSLSPPLVPPGVTPGETLGETLGTTKGKTHGSGVTGGSSVDGKEENPANDQTRQMLLSLPSSKLDFWGNEESSHDSGVTGSEQGDSVGSVTPPELPPDAPEWERAYWERRRDSS